MREIFRGDLVNVQKALSYLAYTHRFDDTFIQPFINKYKDKNFYTYRCYINDKGNFVLERNSFKYYLKDEVFKGMVERQKEYMNWDGKAVIPNFVVNSTTDRPRRVDKRKLARHRYKTLLERVNNQRYNSIQNNIENIYIKNEKIIIKSYKEIYYICNTKIRRVDLSKIDTDFKIWIAHMLINPFERGSSKITNFNYITNDIYTELCKKDALMNYQNNPLYDWDEREGNSYKRFMPLTKNQIQDYKDTIASYFPLLHYVNFLINNNVLNSFTQESELPSYLKKKIATNYEIPCLRRDDLYFIVKAENPVLNMSDNHNILDSYSLCKTLKLQDVNIIKKFIDSRVGLNDFTIKEVKLYYKYLKAYYEGKVKNIELLLFTRLTEGSKPYVEVPRNTTVQPINSLSIEYQVRDSLQMFYKAMMLRRYVKDKPFKKLDMTYLIKNSLKDIHDTLAQISRDDIAVLNYKNFDEVNDYEKYEKEVGDQKFLMPRNSCELIRLADIMRNCVASYQDNIMRKSSIIVYGTSSDEIINYIREGEGNLTDLTNKLEANQIPSPACIELGERANYSWDYRVDETTEKTKELKVIQCYGRHNRKLSTLNNTLATACSTYFSDVKARPLSNI